MRRKASEEEVERAASGASKVVGGAGRKANERGGVDGRARGRVRPAPASGVVRERRRAGHGRG
jgi:hypothetical protein